MVFFCCCALFASVDDHIACGAPVCASSVAFAGLTADTVRHRLSEVENQGGVNRVWVV
jgi:hypothetical protein